MEWKEGWKLSRRLSVDITVESAWNGTERNEEERETRESYEERQKHVERGGGGVTRKRRAGYEISYACLSVRLKLRAQPAAANLEEELGRETNISAEKRRRERKRIVRIVG